MYSRFPEWLFIIQSAWIGKVLLEEELGDKELLIEIDDELEGEEEDCGIELDDWD